MLAGADSEVVWRVEVGVLIDIDARRLSGLENKLVQI